MKTKIFAVSTIALALIAGSTQAAVGTATVPMVLNITSNTSGCTITPSAASFNLPNGTATQGIQDWAKTAGFTQTSLSGRPGSIAGSTYDQTVAIACIQPNITITSILVAPAPVNNDGRTGIAYMLDTAGNKLAGGNVSTWVELVSVTSQTGTTNPNLQFFDANGAATPYATPFMTSSTLNAANQSTASFVWHPALYASTNAAMGTPTGGAFITPWIVTVNY